MVSAHHHSRLCRKHNFSAHSTKLLANRPFPPLLLRCASGRATTYSQEGLQLCCESPPLQNLRCRFGHYQIRSLALGKSGIFPGIDWENMGNPATLVKNRVVPT